MSQMENWAERGMPPRLVEVLGRDEDYVYISLEEKDPFWQLAQRWNSNRFYSKLSQRWEYKIPRTVYDEIMRHHRPQRRPK